ncbi:MAG: quinone-dependent dihydroorotate dehydrogenase [Saprospiraceae bacterium]|nr:quinone-dependent dihydroorotate dehydrogenase [Saprospiraceae bacterium]
MYKNILKPFLFQMAPEKAHHLTVALLKLVLSIPVINQIFRSAYRLEDSTLNRELMGLQFKNPVGLAAGFDKDGKYFRPMTALGFGFIEVGTVTPKGQAGNPQPRLFRLPQDEALINRMGFNNEGVEALVSRLQAGKPKGVIIGGNIGKNKLTPNEEATSDYTKCFEALFPYVDYFVVNVSSPNTPNLRDLQEKEPLTALLSTLQKLNQAKDNPKPILLKIAPDLTDGQLDDIVDIVGDTGIQGLIATNTTISRANLHTTDQELEKIGAGGLSGQPVKGRATEVIRYLRKKLPAEAVIIGVGGIQSAADALEKIEAGADLVQIYTGLIYEGPSLIKQINQQLIQQAQVQPA